MPLQAVVRPPWQQVEGDDWRPVADIAQAVTTIPSGATCLLALGSQHIAPFRRRADVTFIVRMVDPPGEPLPLPSHRLVLGRPGATAEAEAELLRAHGVDCIVCRNSGGPGAYAKIAAARDLGLPVIMIDRPPR